MPRIIIGFSRPKSKLAISSYVIRIAENSAYSHAYLRWYSNGIERDMVYHASHGMVHFISGNRFDAEAITVSKYEISLTDEQFKSVMQKCVDLAGTKYGTLQLLGMALEKITGIKNPFRDGNQTFVCSELVGEVLRQLFNIDTDLERAGPKELERKISVLPGFVKIV